MPRFEIRTAPHNGNKLLYWANCVSMTACVKKALAGKVVLAHAVLSHCDLSGLDFTDAQLNSADLSYADLRAATFRRARLVGTLLTRARATGANFSNAALRYARGAYAQFHAASFDMADCSGLSAEYADFSDAHITTANFQAAVLYGANLATARCDPMQLTATQLQHYCGELLTLLLEYPVLLDPLEDYLLAVLSDRAEMYDSFFDLLTAQVPSVAWVAALRAPINRYGNIYNWGQRLCRRSTCTDGTLHASARVMLSWVRNYRALAGKPRVASDIGTPVAARRLRLERKE